MKGRMTHLTEPDLVNFGRDELGMFWFFRQFGEVGRVPPAMEAPE